IPTTGRTASQWARIGFIWSSGSFIRRAKSSRRSAFFGASRFSRVSPPSLPQEAVTVTRQFFSRSARNGFREVSDWYSFEPEMTFRAFTGQFTVQPRRSGEKPESDQEKI